MPTLNWIGKEAVINHHDEVPIHTLTLDRDRSFGYDNEPLGTGNLLVEGDNLTALKALLPYYAGKVKCIFIDPPYNTGNESWVYNDNVNNPTIQKWLGKTVGSLAVDLSRHDKWLCMMYPRLCLLHQFLQDDGAIFITIDDNEVHHLRLLMDEIFGEENFIANIAWEKRYSRNNDAKLFYSKKDSVLVFRKSKDLALLRETRTDEANSLYKNPDNDPRGPWMTTPYARKSSKKHDNLVYPITNPNTGETVIHPDYAWRCTKEQHEIDVKENRLWWGKDGKAKYPRLKRFLSEVSEGMVPIDIWFHKESGTSDEGTKEVKQIFNTENTVFDYPKPTRLIRRIINLVTTPDGNDIVLDSFAGSGTTGHAVLEQNREDGGNRQFILVELEPEIAREITAVRLQRVCEGYPDATGENLQRLFAPDKETFAYYHVGETFLERREIPFHEMAQYLFFKETGTPIATDTVVNLMEGDRPSYASCSTRERYQRAFLGSVDGIGVYLFNNEDILNDDLIDRLPRHEGRKIIHCGGTQLSIGLLKDRGVTFRQMPYNLV